MRMYDLILKKRNGGILSKNEIETMIFDYTIGKIPDYQMSAMMMAIYFSGMNDEETFYLTMAMAHSGDMLDLSGIKGIKVDKHSTGGVGDKTSLTLAPMVASCGLSVAKMSGRGLGHTGGTIDKLESFKGFRTDISTEEFIYNVNNIGMAIMGQTKNLAPADKKLYALRDVTATVDNMSLIASSIMSKKLAAGSDAIVLDVKTGSGAFMKNEEDAKKLAEIMVRMGKMAGRKTIAVITDMEQPLGYAVGNALEAKEAMETLKGNGPEDFTKLCLTLGSHMLIAGNVVKDEKEAFEKLNDAIKTGKAFEKFVEFIKAQGGLEEQVRNPSLLPKAEYTMDVYPDKEGYVEKIACDEVGMCSLILGGGRENKDSRIDLSVGLILHKKVGDYVTCDTPIATIHASSSEKMETVGKRLLGAYSFCNEKVEKRDLIRGIIS